MAKAAQCGLQRSDWYKEGQCVLEDAAGKGKLRDMANDLEKRYKILCHPAWPGKGVCAKRLQLCPPLRGPTVCIAQQAPLSMGFSKQEHWSGLPCPPPGDLPHPEIGPESFKSAALSGGFFTTRATWGWGDVGH